MYCLVQFPIDGSYDILNFGLICTKKSAHFVRYNRKWYKANILHVNESESFLSEILSKLLMNPVVLITRAAECTNSTEVDVGFKSSVLQDAPILLEQSTSVTNLHSHHMAINMDHVTPPLSESECISNNHSGEEEGLYYKSHSSNDYGTREADASFTYVKRNLMLDFDEDDHSEYAPSDDGTTSSTYSESTDGELTADSNIHQENIDGELIADFNIQENNCSLAAASNCENLAVGANNSATNCKIGYSGVMSSLDGRSSKEVKIDTVPASHTGAKKFFCIFCKNKYSKLARHLQTVHKHRQEVKAFTAIPAGNPERQRIISLLRSAGNFEYNTDSNHNTGDLMVSRRPQCGRKRIPDDYMCCMYCRNFYSKVSLRRHVKVCPAASYKNIKAKNYVMLGRKVYPKLNIKASQVLKTQIFAHMYEDEVVKCIRYDELIVLFGNELCLRYRDEHFHKMIRSQLRLIGRLLIILKKKDSGVQSMADVFNPERFQNVMDAVQHLGNTEGATNIMKSPGVALNAGTLLRKIAKFYVSVCIQVKNEEEMKNAKNFLWLMDTHFNSHVSQTAFESRLRMSRKKKTELPPDEDIRKFMIYLLSNIKRIFSKLSAAKFDCTDWKNLASFCLLWIIAFNRRRVGEVERLKIEDFNEYQTVDSVADENMFKSLTCDGQNAAKNLTRVVLRGKLGRTVPILLCNSVFSSIKLILKYRSKAHVPESNPYVFGLPGAQNNRHLEGCKLLRIHSVECGASKPNLLRGTILRKHIATQCVLLNLTDQEVSDLANYMGHDEKIHRGIYRLPIVAREITQISQILEKAQNIKISEIDTAVSVDNEILQQVDDETNSEASEEFQASVTSDCSQSGSLRNSSIPMGKRSLHDDSDDDVCPIAKKIKKGNSNLTKCTVPEILSPPLRKEPWSAVEINTVKKIFQKHISLGKSPNIRECCEAIRNHSELSKRSPQAIKTWISSRIKQPSLPKKSVRKRWTPLEKQVLSNEFKDCYMTNKLPTLRKCQEIIDKHSAVLKDRTPEIVKAKINNDLRKLQRI